MPRKSTHHLSVLTESVNLLEMSMLNLTYSYRIYPGLDREAQSTPTRDLP
jgi:hypothetical protein